MKDFFSLEEITIWCNYNIQWKGIEIVFPSYKVVVKFTKTDHGVVAWNTILIKIMDVKVNCVMKENV